MRCSARTSTSRLRPLAVATIIEQTRAAHARVLAASVAREMPGTRLVVLVVGEAAGVSFDSVSADVRRPADLGLEEGPAVRPEFLRAMLDEEECVVLLDPEVEIYGQLDDVLQGARDHGISLVPSVLLPIPLDGLSPTEPDLQALGIYNAGCIAVGQGARLFLDWHAAHLRAESAADVAAGFSLDERWIDFVPAYFDHHVVRDPGLGVGAWNLHERYVTDTGGHYRVNGSPLRLFNFRGFDPATPSALTTHRFASGLPLRSGIREQPKVAGLRDAYARALGA